MMEIEKKYRLTKKQRAAVVKKLVAVGATRVGEEFEQNTLYTNARVDLGNAILRLRRVGASGILTHKERLPRPEDIKHQREIETGVEDPEAMARILTALKFTPTLIYEKYRETWQLNTVEVVIDRLPFGLFMEIEGSVRGIKAAEKKLEIADLVVEPQTYPALTRQYGKNTGEVVVARFD
jgi:adenylate cyclase class 2